MQDLPPEDYEEITPPVAEDPFESGLTAKSPMQEFLDLLGNVGEADDDAALEEFEAFAAEDMPPMPDLLDLPADETEEDPPPRK